MHNEFLKFADEIISIAHKTHSVIYDTNTRHNYEYDFDEDNSTEMHAMGAIASVYGFSFEPIIEKAETRWDNDVILGFKIEK